MPNPTSPLLSLNNGIKIPTLGLGLYEVSGGVKAMRVIDEALEIGYRHFDTASVYQNERDLGQVFSSSGLLREEIFITTKLWNSDHGYDSAFRAFDSSLTNLKVDYIDLYLLHWPVEHLRMDTWRALTKLVDQGVCRAIGVSNYTAKHLDELLSSSFITPALNQVEFHPFLYQKELLDFCSAKDIQIEAYSPLTQGRKLRHPKLVELSKKYDKSPAQILIRWAIEHNLIVIPRATRREHLEENINVFDFTLTPKDILDLNNLDEGLRVNWDPSGVP
jgi:methylglyoxal/glyoxal reductase